MMATLYQERKMAIPEMHPEHQDYWDAAAEGRLLIKYCKSCEQYHYYPRNICIFCMSDETVWKEATGTGIIYTFSIMRRAKPAPYAIAYVELDEGPKMMTNIVDCDLDSLEIGQKVKLVFKQTGDADNLGPYVPCFTPV
ncbi:Zn-ribbon domain-containing OB-fold protein [Oceanobacillus saliphilus]|uniref:Zn-ribbon domain-containing OB-fold protein n=1 Tax=Oceanobacillus saliphilus TaxID=2925834 RepID=UPI00201DDA9E|nr:Zn-ribbon domain-containing OB-fold protein [Oceanobacillus saliphilus]